MQETKFTEENSILNYTLVDQKMAIEKSNGSFLKGYINGKKYTDLVKLLGQPTFPPTLGGSYEKTQLEWVIQFEGDIFTIYDWKTYDTEYTLNELQKWHVGGHKGSDPDRLIQLIESAA